MEQAQQQTATATTTDTNIKTPHNAPGFELGVCEDRNKRCRRTMEDAHTFIFDYMGIPRQGFFAIFDGHAGKATAEWCGANFDKVLAKVIESSTQEETVPEILNKAFLAVDSEVNQREGKFSGCTAIVAFVKVIEDKRILYTGNVGDARAVLCRQNKAVRLSYDHKGSDSQEAKRIMDLGGFMMNNRVNGVLAVTRSLGDSVMKEFVVGNPFTTETELGPNDDFLILACDGLWDVCEDQDAVDLIKDIKDPQVASQKLLDHALANFSTDNLSIMVIRLN
ncbi:hypothetical protein MBANPS3_004412 [Mucor bainieri]